MKSYDLIMKPMCLSVFTSKKNSVKYFKLSGLIPVKNNDSLFFSANNIGEEKFSTCEIFDTVEDVVGIEEVIDNFYKIKKLNLTGFWNNGTFMVVSVKVVE